MSMGNHAAATKPVLKVRDLDVRFPDFPDSTLHKVSFELGRGDILGLVGESGCGKSLLARTIMRLETPAEIAGGSIIFEGKELTALSKPDLRQLRGRGMSYVVQDPRLAFDPLFTVGSQIREVLQNMKPPSLLPRPGLLKRPRKAISAALQQLLSAVGVADPDERLRQYPHEWSRGMLQRAQIVMAFSTSPQLVILDEVTSALDPTISLQILDLIRRLQRKKKSGILFITHDLNIAKEICCHIAVMRHGTLLEKGSTDVVFARPRNPYTRRLLSE